MSNTRLEKKAEVDLYEVDLAQAKRVAIALRVNMAEDFEVLPLMWHWLALQQPVFATSTGGLLPEIDNCTRMWSGGSVVNFEQMKLGSPIRRVSSISSLKEKAHGAAVRAFIALKHDYYQNDRLITSEEQDIVYCDTTQLMHQPASYEAQKAGEVVTLFRYVKSPFGANGIHYDWRHITGLSGMMGAVIHDAQSAMMMLREFHKLSPESVIRSVGCDGVKPLPWMEQFYLTSRVLRKHAVAC